MAWQEMHGALIWHKRGLHGGVVHMGWAVSSWRTGGLMEWAYDMALWRSKRREEGWTRWAVSSNSLTSRWL